MHAPTRGTVVAAAVLIAGTLARAQGPSVPHVRGDKDAGRLLGELLAHSATARALVDVVEHSDLVVYVRQRWLTSATLRGRVGCLASDARHRMLVIEIRSQLSNGDQLIALGHELQHAVEIAGAPHTCDAESLKGLYTRIGELTGTSGSFETFETRAAIEAADRVRQELAAPFAPPLLADPDRH